MSDSPNIASLPIESEGIAGYVMTAESAPAMVISTRTIIKAAFRCPEAKYYGAFVLILPDATEPNATLCQIIGNNSLYGAVATEMPWRELTKQIQAYRYQAPALSRNAMVAVEEFLLQNSAGGELPRMAGLGPTALQQYLLPQLSRILADRGCTMEVTLEQVDAAEVTGLPAGESQTTRSMLQIRFLIDPLNGIPAHRLTPGNKVAVNLQSVEAVDRALIEQYQPRDQRGKPLPLFATITSVADRNDGAVEIIVAVDDKVQGGAIISKTLRLRGETAPAANASSPAESAPKRPAPARPEMSPDLLTAVFSVLGVICLLLFLFFLASRWS